MSSLKSQGIKTMQMDATSESSVAACVAEISKETDGSLDALCSNAGIGHMQPISEISISDAKAIFDINFWAIYTTTQACLPLLMQSKHGAMVINHTSIASVLYVPFQSVYNTSKAAAAMLTQTMRLELAPFNIRVYDLKTGRVKSNIFKNGHANGYSVPPLKDSSYYNLIREAYDNAASGKIQQDNPDDPTQDTDEWAHEVFKDLESENPPLCICRGANANIPIPSTILAPEIEAFIKVFSGIAGLDEKLKERKKSETVNSQTGNL